MKALVLGGTRFVGRALVEALLARGDEVTLLHRGRTHTELFPEARRILAERRKLTAADLGEGAWDVVYDVSGYFPAEVDASLSALAGRARRYVYCSTVSVYAQQTPYPIHEDAQLFACSPAQGEDPDMATYGARKAECERRLVRRCEAAGLPLFIGRPTVVYGPHDHTDRMHFWLAQGAAGHAVIPGDGLSIVHTVFVRDLATAFLALGDADAALAGAYNLAATELASLGELVDAIERVVGKTIDRRHVPATVLEAKGIRGGVDIPLWYEPGHFIVDVSRATSRLGFRSTPLDDALRVTYEAWRANGGIERPLADDLDPAGIWQVVGITR